MSVLAAAMATLLVALTGCGIWDVYPWQARVPIQDVGAQFVLADVTWFEDEQTVFVFYEVHANQGLSEFSQVEIRWNTDEERQDWIWLEELDPIHTHLEANCGPETMCGSYSFHVELQPRNVDLQLRYHRDGELALAAVTTFSVMLSGLPDDSRSAVVYGVFDRENQHIQWRLRHQFPNIRNEHAQMLGLRRRFIVDDIGYGTISGVPDIFLTNPYGYGLLGNSCPPDFSPHDGELIDTEVRAVFDEVPLPIDSATAAQACGIATVWDATGTFDTMALAQKNPETRNAFAEITTPIDENEAVPFFFEICGDPRSDLHRAMQLQRLFLTEDDVICIDDFNSELFPSRIANLMSEAIDETRTKGHDMVLKIAVSRPDNVDVARQIERAIGLVLSQEIEASTPRLSGAFVFDTFGHVITTEGVARYTLWCPSSFSTQQQMMFDTDDLDAIPDASARSCAVQPLQQFTFSELSLSSLPILPTETQFENFIRRYGAAQTGSMTDLTFLAPMKTPQSENLNIGDFAVGTFFNNEAITAEPGDAFSYCAEQDTGLVIVRVPGFDDQLFPLSFIGDVHPLLMLPRYELGLLWDFPFLVKLNYNSTAAAAIDVPDDFPFAVAVGLTEPAEQYGGGFQWEQDSFQVGPALTQCNRFCYHPTFDSNGVYNVNDTFVAAYPQRCYRPSFPAVGDGGFPQDP